jgi:hypothetical protein
VFNSLCATLILGEPFTRFSLFGTILVSAGALLIALFGAISEPTHDLSSLLLLLGRRPFVIWMIGQAVLVIAILGAARVSKILSPYNKNSPRMRLLRGMCYGCVSGILSAHSLLVAKSAVELLVKSIVDKNNQFNKWQSWMILFWLLALALSQLYYLHRGLKLCSTSVLYPFVFCIYNIIAILDGLIYFDQTALISVLDGCLIALGTVILLAGVVALSWRLHPKDTPSAPPEQQQQPVAQSSLAPGFGLSTSDSDTNSTSTLSPTSAPDEESALLPRSKTLSAVPTQNNPDPTSYGSTIQDTPNLDTTPLKKSVHYAPDLRHDQERRTPSPRLNKTPTSSKRRSWHATNEIWDELEEDAPPLPFTRRHSFGLQSHTGLAPSKLRADNGGTGEHSNNLGLESSGELPSIGDGIVRTGTGRTYRSRARRSGRSLESDTPLLGQGIERHGKVRGQRQEAQGGWWRMRKWLNIRGEDKGKGTSRAREHEDGGGGGGGGDE